MAAAQQGDADAYRHVLAEAAVWLKRFFLRRLPPSMVDDAIQDTLLAVHEKRHTFDPSQGFGPWLAAIARYKWIDRLRAENRADMVPIEDDLAIGDHEEQITTAHALERLLGMLKPAQAEVIRLVKLQGLSIEEAARRTGQSAALVKVNIHRGLGRMNEMVIRGSDVD
ncbi:RNA polymerase subunit sigma-24 (plasmid) [Kozakia baliensis]|uniref:RNA polymerase subunit sigma-24 n=2 Tax=Kozakia baliensis TaxID=153496 RepID=A0A1D8UYZ3_9PROT|nr:sigma-70 family RNA polymerase sigma factor [Kozakia baliensis]AOX18777.1 RNA polymerase subunit sigma-24 [Kozakia baliensis]